MKKNYKRHLDAEKFELLDGEFIVVTRSHGLSICYKRCNHDEDDCKVWVLSGRQPLISYDRQRGYRPREFSSKYTCELQRLSREEQSAEIEKRLPETVRGLVRQCWKQRKELYGKYYEHVAGQDPYAAETYEEPPTVAAGLRLEHLAAATV